MKTAAKLFGTDGIRGEAGTYPLDEQTVGAVGGAVCRFFRRGGHVPRVVVGRDTRASGLVLEKALCDGICAAGGTVSLAGVLPTPGVAFHARDLAADAGVMITASHNPYQDNGIKIFSGSGFKLSDQEESELERSIAVPGPAEKGGVVGSSDICMDAAAGYEAFVSAALPDGQSLRGVKVVLDTANGATYKVAPELFVGLGAEVTVLHDRPDGVNINRDCGSEHTESLSEAVLDRGADLGLAFDGDGDRLIAVDEQGQELTGDQAIIICADLMKKTGRLRGDQVVSTVMSNLGFSMACRQLGLQNHAAKVGDRYVVEEMRRVGAVLGGEPSGHVVFLDRHTTGDGILTGLEVIAAMLISGGPLSTLGQMMEVYPQRMINVEVAKKPALESLPSLTGAIRQVESELGEEGRVLVRYSGTQNMCRVMVEGPSAVAAEKYATLLAEVVKEAVG